MRNATNPDYVDELKMVVANDLEARWQEAMSCSREIVVKTMTRLSLDEQTITIP